jgi:peroxiredoxin
MGRLSRWFAIVLIFSLVTSVAAQRNQTVWSDSEKPLVKKLRTLRSLPDDERVRATRDLAMEIRSLPAVPNKLKLARGLANLSTEGDFGHDTLQQVATTLAAAIKEQPAKDEDSYIVLASLVRYEKVDVSLDDPKFAAAMAKLETDEKRRNEANFTLTDLNGKNWTLRELRGKVVLLNFWATWCPPCRKEMPDLENLSHRFGQAGLVILGISDEKSETVRKFIAQQGITYPVLFDPDRKIHELYQIEGIPKTFIYDREGRIVAQAIDMRTEKQFLGMLAEAGLK